MWLVEIQTILIATIVLLLLLWLLSKIYPSLNLPPGPRGLPLLGNVLALGKPSEVIKNVRKLRQIYNSDIIYMKLGSKDTVFLYDFDLLRQAYSSDKFEARPNILIYKMFDYMGLLAASGSRWKQSRRYILTVLRDFGMGKNRIEEIIQDEIFYLQKEIEAHGNNPFVPDDMIYIAVSNIISSVNFGNRFDYGDKDFQWLVKLLHENLKIFGESQVLNYVPWCRFFPGDIFGYHRMLKNWESILNYIQKRVDEHKSVFDENNIRDVIDALILRQKSDHGDNIYEDKQIVQIVNELFIAGTETTTSTMLWLLLNVIRNPDVQRKVQDEIDKVVPRDRSPNMADKAKLPYTMAVISDVMRLNPSAPFGLPHGNLEQTKIGKFDIPANSIVMYSASDISRDPNYWPSPEKLDPEANFLDKDGNYVNRDHLIPFSVGKRQCPGESMARMELFLFFTALLQKFTFKVDSTKPRPVLTPKVSFLSTPQEFSVVAERRMDDA